VLGWVLTHTSVKTQVRNRTTAWLREYVE
jgi:hypothetical protein